MRLNLPLFFSGIAIVVLAGPVRAADANTERGRYLVEEVGKCQDCHTPRTADGSPDRTRWLKGATLDFAPLHEVPGWHKTAPDLTSSSRLFERWQVKGMTEFLIRGKNPRGGKADPPMPEYHLSRDDAEAIVAYLKSLP